MITTVLDFTANLGDVVVREGHSGSWRTWDGKLCEPAGELHFARVVELRDKTAFLEPIMEPSDDDNAILQPS